MIRLIIAPVFAGLLGSSTKVNTTPIALQKGIIAFGSPNTYKPRLPQSLVIIKPDVINRGRLGAVITMLEDTGMLIHAAEFHSKPQQELIKNVTKLSLTNENPQHYKDHIGSDYFASLVEYMTTGPIMALAVSASTQENTDIYERLKLLAGATDSNKAAPGTIRQRFGTNNRINAIHASDNAEEADRELKLWFPNLRIYTSHDEL